MSNGKCIDKPNGVKWVIIYVYTKDTQDFEYAFITRFNSNLKFGKKIWGQVSSFIARKVNLLKTTYRT